MPYLTLDFSQGLKKVFKAPSSRRSICHFPPVSWSYIVDSLISLQDDCISGGCPQAPLTATTNQLHMEV